MIMANSKLVKTPPMGWNSWDCFGAGVTEKQLKENADYMAKNLLAFGWEYVVCDIQWYEPNAINNDYNNFASDLEMDEYGRLIPAVKRFPSAKDGSGFAPIAKYCHDLGLKFGIHIMRGIPRQAVYLNTPIKGTSFCARDAAHHFSVCSWNTDMYGMKDNEAAQAYYNSLFELYASWGVDFVKCDDICVTEFRQWDDPYNARHEIEMIRSAIDRCGRDIVLSLSPGPADINNFPHLRKNADMWRMTGDFWDQWDKLHDMFDRCKTWEGAPGPGSFPDCDMLPLGVLSKNGTCHGPQNRKTQFTLPEQQTMLSLWGIFRSPLMLGGNLPETDSTTLDMLTNREFLEMHRKSYGAHELLRSEKNSQGTVVWTACGKKCKYAAVFNTASKQRDITLDLTMFLMPDTEYSVYDIWHKKEVGTFKNKVKLTVAPHGAALIKII